MVPIFIVACFGFIYKKFSAMVLDISSMDSQNVCFAKGTANGC